LRRPTPGPAKVKPRATAKVEPVNASTDPVRGFKHDHLDSNLTQAPRCRQPSESAADNDNLRFIYK
jgi:hypothetical protein